MRFVLFMDVKSFRKKKKKFKTALMTSFALLLSKKLFLPLKKLAIFTSYFYYFYYFCHVIGHFVFFIITMLLTGHHAMPVVI